ncbi:hypothetical protein BO99DRAFT_264689 [Aspergillus violaceofuscus CBS 115571]|uniref:Uncharacterized protein n=1 Tax=Aspergillus violaceofuscus (strain CBS 115571) TaxID=1450538 RepID=A0A2V5GVQ3_ASPV1|nr:hypothetical protein BO99DRAFT_264689 [Aspergillus violaceofuscus CBS 115571]
MPHNPVPTPQESPLSTSSSTSHNPVASRSVVSYPQTPLRDRSHLTSIPCPHRAFLPAETGSHLPSDRGSNSCTVGCIHDRR